MAHHAAPKDTEVEAAVAASTPQAPSPAPRSTPPTHSRVLRPSGAARSPAAGSQQPADAATPASPAVGVVSRETPGRAGGTGGGSRKRFSLPVEANAPDEALTAFPGAADDRAVAVNNTAAQPAWSLLDPAAVALAKDVLSTSGCSAPGSVTLCRDHERSLVTAFCEERLQAGCPGSMYISGVPGTGKTLTLRELEKTVRQWSQAPVVVTINCMALPEPRAVFAHIIEGLGDHCSGARANGEDEADVTAVYPEVSLLRRLITQPPPSGAKRRRSSSDAAHGGGRRVLLVLDELDVLVTKSNATLYELFSLPMIPGSRCVLVGAANTMNLIENMLPRLKSLNCEPAIVPFPAYSVQQLGQLLRARLDRLPWKAFDSFAVELCARRVAAASGDMRRALMCACAALDVAVTKAAGRAGPCPDDDDGELPRASAPAAAPTTVTIADMSDALSSIFQTPVVDLVSSLPRDRKVVLCALMQLLQKTGRQDTSLGQVHDAYVALCHSLRSMQAVSASEFWTLCSSLADDSLISCTSSGGRSRAAGGWDRKCRVTLCASGDDVLLALQRHPSFADALRATKSRDV